MHVSFISKIHDLSIIMSDTFICELLISLIIFTKIFIHVLNQKRIKVLYDIVNKSYTWFKINTLQILCNPII